MDWTCAVTYLSLTRELSSIIISSFPSMNVVTKQTMLVYFKPDLEGNLLTNKQIVS